MHTRIWLICGIGLALVLGVASLWADDGSAAIPGGPAGFMYTNSHGVAQCSTSPDAVDVPSVRPASVPSCFPAPEPGTDWSALLRYGALAAAILTLAAIPLLRRTDRAQPAGSG